MCSRCPQHTETLHQQGVTFQAKDSLDLFYVGVFPVLFRQTHHSFRKRPHGFLFPVSEHSEDTVPCDSFRLLRKPVQEKQREPGTRRKVPGASLGRPSLAPQARVSIKSWGCHSSSHLSWLRQPGQVRAHVGEAGTRWESRARCPCRTLVGVGCGEVLEWLSPP